MLAAIGLIDVVLAAIQRAAGVKLDAAAPEAVSSTERNILIYLVAYLLFSAYQFGFQLSSATLYPQDRQAMAWASQNTPADSRFLVLTGTTSVSCDSVLEWFPALSGRQSIYTVQGREWTEGQNFNAYVRSTYDVQECLASGDQACLDEATDPSQYDYVYISKLLRVNNCTPMDLPRTFPLFLDSLSSAPGFVPVFETEEVAIFRRE
jgi:hypothetical protein